MAEPLDNAVEREQRDFGARIFEQRKTRLRGADFRDRGGNRARQQEPRCDHGLRLRMRGGDEIDQVGVAQQRRTLQDRCGNQGLIGRKRMHDHRRCGLARGEHLGKRAPHQRRRIVEQHRHRAFSGGAIIGRQIGMEIGARERGSGIGPLTGRGIAQPLQKLTNNHPTNRRNDKPRTLRQRSAYAARLNKPFTMIIERVLTTKIELRCRFSSFCRPAPARCR